MQMAALVCRLGSAARCQLTGTVCPWVTATLRSTRHQEPNFQSLETRPNGAPLFRPAGRERGWGSEWGKNTRKKPSPQRLQPATCNLQPATCNLQPAEPQGKSESTGAAPAPRGPTSPRRLFSDCG